MTIPVLFMQSQSYFGSDCGVHARIIRALDRREVDVHVACNTERLPKRQLSAWDRVAELPDIHVKPVNFGPTITGQDRAGLVANLLKAHVVPRELLGLAAYIRKHKIKIIHGTEKPRDAFYGVVLGMLTGAKSIVHVHIGYDARWLSPLVKWAMARADGVIGVSRFVADTLIERARLSPSKVHAVVNALDPAEDSWDPSADGLDVRRELGIPESAKVIGIVSRLFKWKGHSYLVDAMAEVRKVVPEALLLIVGEDDPRAQDGQSFRRELEQQIARLGIQDAVKFTGFRTDIPRILSSLDVFALPSWEEPCAMAYFEAMAAGLPVVGWTSGGTPEIVVDGVTGFLTKPRDQPALVDALVKLLQSSELREQFGAAGRKHLEQDLSPVEAARQVLGIYKKTLGLEMPASSPHSGKRVALAEDV